MTQHPLPDPPYDMLMARGLAASRSNDSSAAIRAFQEASAIEPSAALPQFMLGAELAALGDVAQAETALANAVRLAPEFSLARYQLGLLQFSAGRAAVALVTWQPLLTLAPSDPLPYFVKGFEALAQGEFEVALTQFERGLSLNTSNAALSDDIRKVAERIQAMQSAHLAPTTQEPPSADRPSDELAEADTHFLLASYQPKGLAN